MQGVILRVYSLSFSQTNAFYSIARVLIFSVISGSLQ